MGIVYNYLAVKPTLLKKARTHQELCVSLIHPEHEKQERPGVMARITVDKAWDGIAYLLSDERRATDDLYLPSDPLAQAVFGEDDMLGCGWFEEGREPLVVSPAKVRTIADAFASIKRKGLHVHHDIGAMEAADVYGAGYSLEYVLGYFDHLKAFYATAAEAKAAVIVYMS